MPLPNFLIAGAAKCGTTSLAAYLDQHPQVHVAAQKEVHFFELDYLWDRGPGWYEQQFSGAGDAVAIGEGTPNYMFYPSAVDRIAELLPDVRLLVCLRDPVDRAYSHYLHWYDGFGWEGRSFRRAVEDELAEGAERIDDRSTGGKPPYFGYLARGLYARQLERLAQRFGRERIYVVLLDDLKRDPQGTFAGVCRFLGVDDAVVPPKLGERENVYRRHRAAGVFRLLQRGRLMERLPRPASEFVAMRIFAPRPHVPPPVDPAVRARLGEHFAPHNAALAAWLGRDLPGWT